MSLVSDQSQPAVCLDVQQMMSVPPTQECVENSRYDVYPSLQVASASNDIEWQIPTASDGWATDLHNSYIKYSLTTTISANRASVTVADAFVPLPGLGACLFERVALTANGTVLNDETSGQSYLTHVAQLLNMSKSDYLDDLHAWLPTPADDYDCIHSVANQLDYGGSGRSFPDFYAMPTAAAQPQRHGKIVPLGQLFGVATAKRLWPDRVAFQMRVTRHADGFCYSKEGTVVETMAFVINDAEVHIRRVRLSDDAAKHLIAEFALGKSAMVPHLNPRLAQVNFALGQTQFIARGVLPGARPTRVVAFITRTATMSATKTASTMPFCMRDDTTLATRVTRAYCEVAGQTFPQRYLTSTQDVAPGTWSNVDVGAAYHAYKMIAHPQDPVLGERDFYGRMLFAFDTSPSGSSGEAVYDPTEQTAVDVTIDFYAATASAMTLNVLTYTPRVIEISPSREVVRI